MSTARGNVRKTGPPKHQNKTAFKNDLHDTSRRTKEINAMEVVGACPRCTEVIEWKIKYKKYKPLTVPKKCTLCSQKSVKRAYYIMCDPCQERTGRCAKCGKSEEIVAAPGLSAAEEARQRSDFDRDIKALTERQRRSFFRLQAKGKLNADVIAAKTTTATSGDDSENDDDDVDEAEHSFDNDLSDTGT